NRGGGRGYCIDRGTIRSDRSTVGNPCIPYRSGGGRITVGWLYGDWLALTDRRGQSPVHVLLNVPRIGDIFVNQVVLVSCARQQQQRRCDSLGTQQADG